MSEDYQRIKVITEQARQQRWSTEQKLRIIEENCRSRGDGSVGFPTRWRGAEPSVSLAALDERGSRWGGGSDELKPNGQSIRRNGEHYIEASDRK